MLLFLDGGGKDSAQDEIFNLDMKKFQKHIFDERKDESLVEACHGAYEKFKVSTTRRPFFTCRDSYACLLFNCHP